MATFLTALSGIAWSIVYIELIRKGFKECSKVDRYTGSGYSDGRIGEF